MKTITLMPKVYGQYRNRLLSMVQTEIESLTRELELDSLILETTKSEHLRILVDGPDSEFVVNLLAKEYGKAPEMHEILPDIELKGQLIDMGKVGFGAFVDIGLISPRVDVLLPLHRLREQLRFPNMALRRIARSCVLVDYLPVDIRVTELRIDAEQIEGEFSQQFLKRLETWIGDDHERLLVFGANRRMIERALEMAGHSEDIYQIEHLGRFEFSLRCKRSTRASGILAAIGPRLKGVPMHLFIPHEIQAAREDASA